MRDLFELKNLGDYEMIYPCQEEEKMLEYQMILEASREIWEKESGAATRKRKITD